MSARSTRSGVVKRQQSVVAKKRKDVKTLGSKTSLETLDSNNNSVGRANQLDGAFFEVYNSLKEKQDERVHEAGRKSLFTYDDLDKVIVSQHSLDLDQAKELYKELIYTIMHRLGKKQVGDGVLMDGEIYSYGRKVFNIDGDTHKQIYNEMKETQPPECLLNLDVLEGCELDPKDANGFSDPYCMLCLINSGENDKTVNGTRKKEPLRQFKAKDAKVTKVMKKTLNPVWKQSFKFDVKDIQNQVLRIDVWDQDDNSVMLDKENTLSSIKDFKGAGRWCKEIIQFAKNGEDDLLDDFMGLVEVPLQMITEKGVEAWFQMEHRTAKKKVHGKLLLKIWFSSKKEEGHSRAPLQTDRVYEDLLNAFAHYDCKTAIEKEETAAWDGILSPAAQNVLLHYEMQHELHPLQQTIVKWQVYSRVFSDVTMPLEVFMEILESYKKHMNNNDGVSLEKEQEEFFTSLDDFVTYSFRLLKKYRFSYSSVKSEKCIQLGKLLMCLMMIYQLPLYKSHYPEKLLKSDVEKAVEDSTMSWFLEIQGSLDTGDNSPSGKLNHMVQVTNALNADMQQGKKSYEPIFNLLKLQYIAIVLRGTEVLLSEMIEAGTRGLDKILKSTSELSDKDEIGTRMFELYLGIRDIYAIKQTILKEEQCDGGIDNYKKWFKKGVIKWLDLAGAKAKERIYKAIELDEVCVIDDMVKHSTSAVDVTCCLGQICTFWKRLDWPDPDDAYMFLIQITGIVGECGMCYADIIFKGLLDKGFYDDEGQFDVTDQLCIMMNNAAHVIQFFHHLHEALGYTEVIDRMGEIHGESRTGELLDTLTKIVRCAVEDMDNRIDKILSHVGTRMKESFHPYIIKILRETEKPFETVSEPLLEYLDSNLITLNTTLLTQVFDRILAHFWDDFVGCCLSLVEKSAKKLTVANYNRLSEVVQMVKEFFHGNGNGLSDDILNSKSYEELTAHLQLHKSPTEELIVKFYRECCEDQKMVESNMGSLTFKAFYDNLTRKLNIYVLNCNNLLPMDASGNSDPYIKLQLKPDHLHPEQQIQKTKVEKKTLYPLFDQTFQFDIPASICSTGGATLLFTLFDHDILSDDDMFGEVYFDLNNVIGLDMETVQGGFTCVPQIELPIFGIPFKGRTVEALVSRSRHDDLASNFIHKQKERNHKISENIGRGFDILAKK